MMRFRRRKRIRSEIEPYEIFLDSKNLPQFNTQQMEGRLERPISKYTTLVLGIVFLLFGVIFIWQLTRLQVVKGAYYHERSEVNSLNKKPIFADRGIIYDRNGIELAWNTLPENDDEFPHRAFKDQGFAHLLGYVGYPAKDKSGNYWRDAFVGRDGIEKQYNDTLGGVNGLLIFETDALGNVSSESVVNPPEHGTNLTLSVDARVQERLHQGIVTLAENSGYVGGGAVIMDIETGEIIAMTSYPEYDPELLSLGDDRNTINGYFSDKAKPFMNRTVDGVYTPGSIVKPFMAIGALNEGIISPLKKIFSSGELVIPNRYSGEDSVFKDNKAHGWVDMRRAIAVSSNVYFYVIGGGFQDQRGLGITNMEKYVRMFGIGEETGIDFGSKLSGTIPSPAWKEKHFPGDPWRVGDTYHTVIGQYGFQVTPIQMVRAVGAIANNGKLVTPHIIKDEEKESRQITEISPEHYQVIREAMRMTVTDGTAIALNIPGFTAGAKTGTAQVGISKNRINAWAIGFFPYEKPRYAFVVLMESGRTEGSSGAVHAIRPVFQWMVEGAPEYLF